MVQRNFQNNPIPDNQPKQPTSHSTEDDQDTRIEPTTDISRQKRATHR